jgi:hypothetical protein
MTNRWFSAFTSLGRAFRWRVALRRQTRETSMSTKLPACLRPNAQPFTRVEFAALMLDEIGKMVQEGYAAHRLKIPEEAHAYSSWWSVISESERESWRQWMARDIQVDQIRPAMQRNKRLGR